MLSGGWNYSQLLSASFFQIPITIILVHPATFHRRSDWVGPISLDRAYRREYGILFKGACNFSFPTEANPSTGFGKKNREPSNPSDGKPAGSLNSVGLALEGLVPSPRRAPEATWAARRPGSFNVVEFEACWVLGGLGDMGIRRSPTLIYGRRASQRESLIVRNLGNPSGGRICLLPHP